MNEDNRLALLRRARAGDAGSLGELLDGFRPYVRAIVRGRNRGRLVRRMDDSDLIQDALLAAHRAFGRFAGSTVAELAAWLRLIAVRTVQHAHRDQLDAGRRGLAAEEALDVEDLTDAGRSPNEQAIRHEESARLAEAVEQLPDDMRQVFLGRHAEQLPYAVLAERLGRSEEAARALYTRCLRRLRGSLRE
jgi:RNA polymerase sigma-70 factor, ECF subfamily